MVTTAGHLFDAHAGLGQAQNAIWMDPEQVIERLDTANPMHVRLNDQAAGQAGCDHAGKLEIDRALASRPNRRG